VESGNQRRFAQALSPALLVEPLAFGVAIIDVRNALRMCHPWMSGSMLLGDHYFRQS
jgi:hypothetical protein